MALPKSRFRAVRDEDNNLVPSAIDIKVRRSTKPVSHPYWWEIVLHINGFKDGIMCKDAFKTAGEAVANAAEAFKSVIGYGPKEGT